MLTGISSQTVRARVWRGNLDQRVITRTLSQHADILAALVARDPVLAEATAVTHVSTTEAWLRGVVTDRARAARREG
jgi:GntR family transcriptional repressor for pyruvate dehydrogenase complex